jgi:ornithine carbamoyltransferase
MSAATPVHKPDLLRVDDLDASELEGLVSLAARMKAEPEGWLDALPAHSIACLFEKPSTRTRVSFQAAAHRLGMLPMVLRPEELQIGRGEPLADVARVLSGYCAAIVVRTFSQRTLEALAGAASVPVINALSDDHHPCQALADLLTLQEHFGRLRGLRLAYLGDGNNVAHSLMEAGALAGMEVRVATPAGYEPDPQITAASEQAAAEHGGSVVVVRDPRAAAEGADAVYTDVWVSMGDDAERDRRLVDLREHRVDAEVMALAAQDAVFLHCLPAHRGEEVTEEVLDGPSSLVWEQAANRLPTAQAVLLTLISGREPSPSR